MGTVRQADMSLNLIMGKICTWKIIIGKWQSEFFLPLNNTLIGIEIIINPSVFLIAVRTNMFFLDWSTIIFSVTKITEIIGHELKRGVKKSHQHVN